MTEAPKVIWARHLTTVGSVMLGDWGDTVRYVDGTCYIRADAPELVALVEALRNAGTACLHGSGEAWGMRLSESPLGREIIARMDAANAALAKWKALTK